MIRWFRRKRHATVLPPPARIAPEDRMVARWWGFTPQQWAALPPEVQTEKRDTVIWAPKRATSNPKGHS